MGRDSNPRKPCDFNGFQDRRIRPLCHPSETFFILPPVFSNLRFCSLTAPGGAAHHSFALGCTLFALLTRMQDRRYCPASATHPKLLHGLFYTYFFRIAIVKIVAPATNIITDNSVPMVSPHVVRNPICASGARNCSHITRIIA